MAAPLSFQRVKTGGFASPGFPGFAHVRYDYACFMLLLKIPAEAEIYIIPNRA
jgi:hypothetical protein